MKKIIPAIILVPVILFLIWYGIQAQKSNQNSSALPTPFARQNTPSPIPTLPNFQQIVESNTTKNTYQIDYWPQDESYFITILATPFEKYRLEAEEALMKKFNLSRSQACSIKVTVSEPYFVENKVIPTLNGFTFCPRPTLTP